MQQILTQRRESKHSIHFRDDLSEYSSPSSWGDGPGPLSLSDYRVTAEGLQARRTVGEALLQAQWERQCEADAEACGDALQVFGESHQPPLHRLRLVLGGSRTEALRRATNRPSVIFTWTEVQSVILLPYEGKGPYLIAVTTFRWREDGTREWLLQAANLRARARWGIEMSAAILRDRNGMGQVKGNGACKCCGSGRGSSLSTALFMDMVRISCEAARLQPSAEGMERLVEVLDLMMERGEHTQSSGGTAEMNLQFSGAPHFPLAALRRFSDSVRRAHLVFKDWQWWREAAMLLHPPEGWDAELWRDGVLPFTWPAEPSLRDPRSTGYPAAVDGQLAVQLSGAAGCFLELLATRLTNQRGAGLGETAHGRAGGGG
eukprot:CAMPEP_0113836946 /NCGR_PEP_ID=MMETSP0328-20130328/9740_1 /TAXON_ID=39455 /ORGANISM="Alexandrium minutum" /LENGTH=374 /DNA_ID=CAMNT_0000805373 /DNA_START=1 /DNA_END=1121 /DNA_ORIENTATION=- /assembly_acc=CAM_ASM_000350